MKLPKFKSPEEEAEFWEAHSLADYMDDLEEVKLEWALEEDACPNCGSPMRVEAVDIDLGDGLLLQGIRRYRCPICSTVKLAEEDLARINRMDLRIKRYGLAGILLQEELVKKGSG